MALKQLFAIVGMVAIILPGIASATEFIVGDESGWTNYYDYQAWAKDKTFHIGDELVFRYAIGNHNVFKVNGTAFRDCIVPPPNEALTTGNDIITLASPGTKWYICGVGDHCEFGDQKLAITVQPQSLAPTPTPAPAPAPAPAPLSSCP